MWRSQLEDKLNFLLDNLKEGEVVEKDILSLSSEYMRRYGETNFYKDFRFDYLSFVKSSLNSD